jgi:hypothetical protein
MNEDVIWSQEEQFWMAGEAHYRSALDPECIMGFPAPIGIMRGKAILQSLAQAPRWSSVEMSERHVVRPTSDLIALGYRARGNRAGADPYEAFCTSSYRATIGGCKLFQHHQTPIPSVSAREHAHCGGAEVPPHRGHDQADGNADIAPLSGAPERGK